MSIDTNTLSSDRSLHPRVNPARRFAYLCAVAFVATILFGCRDKKQVEPLPKNVAEWGTAARSDFGDYTLEVVRHPRDPDNAFTFQVLDSDGAVIFKQDEILFRRRDVNYFLWDEQDRIWAYSGDVGTFIWERDRGTPSIWQRSSYALGAQVAPAYLVKQRPRYFGP